MTDHQNSSADIVERLEGQIQDRGDAYWEELYRQRKDAAAEIRRLRGDAQPTLGRSAILEEAARIAENGCLVPPDGGSPTDDEREMCESIATQIRLLKLKGAEEVFEPHRGSSAGSESLAEARQLMKRALIDAKCTSPDTTYTQEGTENLLNVVTAAIAPLLTASQPQTSGVTLDELSEFIDTCWANDDCTGLARHILGTYSVSRPHLARGE